jgi:hypothetical protein
VGCSIPKLVIPFVKAELPLFIRSSEVIHEKSDLLHFCAFIRVLEVHDFNLPSSSEEDGGLSGYDCSDDEYPGHVPIPAILHPWPSVHSFVGSISPSGDPSSALHVYDRGAVWSAPSLHCDRCRSSAHRRHDRQALKVQPASSSVPCADTGHSTPMAKCS